MKSKGLEMGKKPKARKEEARKLIFAIIYTPDPF